MTFKLVIRQAAANDIASAHDWYEAQRAGLGGEFLDAIQQTLARVGDRPSHFPQAFADVRRALVKRFPYSIYFHMRAEDVRVIAVLHQHRDPRAWQRRLR